MKPNLIYSIDMAQLGYTWYPKDWFISNTRKRLKRFPMVRYALRELYDLMYIESGPIEMNREYLMDDLDIELTDAEYHKLLEYVTVNDDGRWWINTVRKRISKAEAARENGKKGGRPSKQKNQSEKPKFSENLKTQKPSLKTQVQNPKNPPSERERESKRETKVKEKGNNARASDILNTKKEIEFNDFRMQNQKYIPDWKNLLESYNDTVDLELARGKIEMAPEQLMPRFRKYVRSWINNRRDGPKNEQVQKVEKRNYF